MKKLLAILLFAFTLNANAQEADKTVTLTVSGSGNTLDEAKQNALRSAIEQAFGTFISSKTELLNDALVSDQITSISNGNIQKFDIISEVQIPEGGFATTLKATVSVTKLSSFVESKGVTIEFKGELFGANIKLMKLNEANEITAIKNMCIVLKRLADNAFDFTVDASEPKANKYDNDFWDMTYNVNVKPNQNFELLSKYFNQTLEGVALSIDEINNLITLNKKFFPLQFNFYSNPDKQIVYNFRSSTSYTYVVDFLNYLGSSTAFFQIHDGIDTLNAYERVLMYNFGYRYEEKYKWNVITNWQPIIWDINLEAYLLGNHWGLFYKYYKDTILASYHEYKKQFNYYSNSQSLQDYAYGYNKKLELFADSNTCVFFESVDDGKMGRILPYFSDNNGDLKINLFPFKEGSIPITPSIGVQCKEELNLKIIKIFENSTASNMGLLVGDSIISFNGTNIHSGKEMNDLKSLIKVDDELTIGVIRNGSVQILKSKIKGRIQSIAIYQFNVSYNSDTISKIQKINVVSHNYEN